MKKTLLIVLLLLVGCEKKTTDVPSIIKQAAEERPIDLSSSGSAPPGKVWSEEHGHWHDIQWSFLTQSFSRLIWHSFTPALKSNTLIITFASRRAYEAIRSTTVFGYHRQAGGFSFDDVVQVQVYLSDLNNYAAMNVVYAKYFEDDPPARAVVEAARIPRDALVEIMMVAQQPWPTDSSNHLSRCRCIFLPDPVKRVYPDP